VDGAAHARIQSFYYLIDKVQSHGKLNSQGNPVKTGATAYSSQVPVSKQDLRDQILGAIEDVQLATYI
jgi:hypothetical protein